MILKIQYSVIEHYEDDAPEHFGYVDLEAAPRVDDVIQLKWLSGKDAYQVRVYQVRGMTLDVRRFNARAAL